MKCVFVDRTPSQEQNQDKQTNILPNTEDIRMGIMCNNFIILIHMSIQIAIVFSSTVEQKESEMTSVWVVSGGRVDLPCRPRPKLKDDKPLLVLWYRSSYTLPIYSYDARVGGFSSGVRWADEVTMGGRAYFTATANPPALVLEPAHAHDEGIYTCRVDYRISSPTTDIINLTVVVPPGPPVIIWDRREMVGTVGPLDENELTELICRSVGGRPTPVLSWWHNGRELPLLSTNSSADPVTGARTAEAWLSVTAKRDLQGESLTCYAHTPTNSHTFLAPIIQPRSASVTLNITLSPVEVRILETDTVTVTGGSTFRVICRAIGSHPPAELSWWRGNEPLEPHVTHAIEDGGNITMATLTMVIGGDDDGVLLTCKGANPALPSQPHMTDSTRLIVYYEPVVELTLGRPLEAESIKEGDDVYFECDIRANPPFHRIEWFQNGLTITQNLSVGVLISGESLVLQGVQRRHSGSYTCSATNLQGRTTSNTLHLVVRHAPICTGLGQGERTLGAARGTQVTATCRVDAEPSRNLSWSWVRRRTDGGEEKLPKEDFTVLGLTSTIRVTPERREDYGRLLCLATNAVGRQKEPCAVHLVPAGPPDSPTNCSAAPINPDDATHSPIFDATLAVTCLEGFDGGLPQHFLLEAWQDGKVFANLSNEFPEWVVGGVRSGTEIKIIIFGHNARGRSDPVAMEVHTSNALHRAAPDKKNPVEISPFVGVVLGVVGIVLVLLLVGIATVRKAQSCQRKPTIEMMATGTSGEGFDPDIVQSIHKRPPSLDVLPHQQETEEVSMEESQPLCTYPKQQLPLVHRPELAISQEPNAEADEGKEAAGAKGQDGKDSYPSSCRQRFPDAGRQVLELCHAQSDGSGVSESESDSEPKHQTNEGMKTTTPAYREAGKGKIYIVVPAYSMMSLHNASSVEIFSSGGDSGAQHPSSSVELRMRCSSSTELNEMSDRYRGKANISLRGLSSPRSKTITTSELPLKETGQNKELLLNKRQSLHERDLTTTIASPTSKGRTKEKRIFFGKSNAGIPVNSFAEQKRIVSFDRNNMRIPVTLLEAEDGEIVYLARRSVEIKCPADNEQVVPSVYSLTTLPKASSKSSQSIQEKEIHVDDVSPTKIEGKKQSPVLPKSASGLDMKHSKRREYVHPANPDVCRRESSV